MRERGVSECDQSTWMRGRMHLPKKAGVLSQQSECHADVCVAAIDRTHLHPGAAVIAYTRLYVCMSTSGSAELAELPPSR